MLTLYILTEQETEKVEQKKIPIYYQFTIKVDQKKVPTYILPIHNLKRVSKHIEIKHARSGGCFVPALSSICVHVF